MENRHIKTLNVLWTLNHKKKHKEKVSINRLIKRHICFNLSSSLTLKTSPTESPFCGPHSFARCVPTRWQTRFFIYFVKKWFLEKILGVAAYFNFFLKGKQNKKENLIWLLIWKRQACEKSSQVWGSNYLLGRYGKKTVAPL